MLRDILQTKDKRFQDLEKEKAHQVMQNDSSFENENVVTGNEVNGDHMGRSDQESVVGSDEESSFMEQSRIDEAEVDDVKSDGEENCSNDVHSTSESKEAKRARVDNIISSMQHPGHFIDPDSLYSSEVRRQKRKQNIPQQHESIPKSRKLDNQHCEDDLWNLRLFAVQNYFKQQEDNLHKQMNGFPAMENIHRLHQAYFANLSARHPERIPSPPPKPMGFPVKSSKITTDHFNIAEHVRESVNANKVGDLDDKELNELIANLKSKIEEAVSVTVDKELAKFFQKRKPKEPQAQIERQPKEERIPNNHESRKVDPEKKPTNHSLDHILQLPEKTNPINNGFRLPERQSAFELPKLGGGITDIPRPPFPHHPPLAYPPLSFYLPSNLHPPSLYSCPIVPPEQTEALSLVVNTPKKKRTKVTDTRLSPRAARALLNDNGTLGAMFDHDRPLSTAGLSHMNHCLPTSVAIPNPSLQHSDIMNFYREQAMCGSPTDNERNTPCSSNSPSDSGYGNFLKNDFFNDSDSFDSQGKQTISFYVMKLTFFSLFQGIEYDFLSLRS